MSPAGLAILFDRAGGSLTGAMSDVIAKMKTNSQHADTLIQEIREIWDTWDAREEGADRGDNLLNYTTRSTTGSWRLISAATGALTQRGR